MKILAIVGSYRKGRTIDTLVDKALEGAQSTGGVQTEKLYLIDQRIEYCRNCMACRRDDESKARAACTLSDDMETIYPKIEAADGYLFGTPVNMGAATAVMKTFLERTCWVYAKPGTWPLAGCPTPRSAREKAAVIIVSSGLVRPLLRHWCDDATPLIKSVCTCSLNAKVVGDLYAGAVERRSVGIYLDKAYRLGEKLARQR